MPVSLSLAMIVRDEAPVLADVLGDAASFCDELVVVDTGSSDESAEVARSFGARVESFEWIDDFAAARNFALDLCSNDWIVSLDADDRVPPASVAGFLSLKEELANLPEIDLVRLPYRCNFVPFDSEVCTINFDVGRVIRNGAGLLYVGRVHELVPDPRGRTMRRDDSWVEHRPRPEREVAKQGRNLRILERAIAEGDRSSRSLYFLGSELRALGRLDEAAATYRRVLLLDPPPESRYQILLELVSCLSAPSEAEERTKLLLEAIATDPSRAGAFVQLALPHYEAGEWEQAVPLFVAAAACSRPASGSFDEIYYSWFPSDCLAVCLSELGRFEEAIEATRRALPGNPDRERLLHNLEVYFDKLSADEQRNSSAELSRD